MLDLLGATRKRFHGTYSCKTSLELRHPFYCFAKLGEDRCISIVWTMFSIVCDRVWLQQGNPTDLGRAWRSGAPSLVEQALFLALVVIFCESRRCTEEQEMMPSSTSNMWCQRMKVVFFVECLSCSETFLLGVLVCANPIQMSSHSSGFNTAYILFHRLSDHTRASRMCSVHDNNCSAFWV